MPDLPNPGPSAKITSCWSTHWGQEMKAELDVAAHTANSQQEREKEAIIGTT